MSEESHPKHHHKRAIHHVLVHSYSTYFFLFIFGVVLDLIFPLKIFQSTIVTILGILLLALAPLLILWAQNTSKKLNKAENKKKEHFSRGPYRFTRNPTHLGLFILALGFGLTVHAFFVVLLTIIYAIFVKTIFLKKEEIILIDKYGEPYVEYKKSVKF